MEGWLLASRMHWRMSLLVASIQCAVEKGTQDGQGEALALRLKRNRRRRRRKRIILC